MAAGKWEMQINNVLLKFGVIKEPFQEDAAEELESTLQDYHDLAAQYSDMLTTFCYEDRPVRRNGVWLCPKCAARKWAGVAVHRKGEGDSAGDNARRIIFRERRI